MADNSVTSETHLMLQRSQCYFSQCYFSF